MKLIDDLLDKLTMYRLLLYFLVALLVAAAVMGSVGVLHFSGIDIAATSIYFVAICWVSNKIFAYAFDAPTNTDSPFITALILALIITPTVSLSNLIFLTAAAGLAIASKYMLAINRQHIFNPAAIAVVLTSLGAGDSASWWVGSVYMLPFVLVGGFLVVRKIRRFGMVFSFVGAALLTTALLTFIGGGDVFSSVQKAVLSSALIFTAAVMLTEPLTSPTTKGKQALYGGLAGVLFSPQVHFFGVFLTPELALTIGNVFSYIISPRVKQFVELFKVVKLSPTTFDFLLLPEKHFDYTPGQYMEFTLQHHGTDSRGARRYFTLSSSPTERELRLGVKFYPKGSSYKKALLSTKTSTPIVAGQLGGDFVLPKNPNQKVCLIAGGIGITPYRSMVKYLLDTKQSRPIVLIYSAKTSGELVYRDVFDAAGQAGVKTIYTVTGEQKVNDPAVKSTRITPELIKQQMPDYAERLFYISGPHDMVVAIERILYGMGIPRRKVKKDYFSGYS